MIKTGQYETYFSKIDKNNTLSDQFKDLIVQLFAENGDERITIEQIRQHPWLTGEAAKSLNSDMTKLTLSNQMKKKQSVTIETQVQNED